MKVTASGFRKTISTLYSLSFLCAVKVEIEGLVNFSHLFQEDPELVLGAIAFPRFPLLQISRSTLWGTSFSVERLG